MSLWQVEHSKLISAPIPPTSQCNGIDISDVSTYIDFTADASLANLNWGPFTAEGWFYLDHDNPNPPPWSDPLGIHWTDVASYLFRKRDSTVWANGWYMCLYRRAHNAGNPYDPITPDGYVNIGYRNTYFKDCNTHSPPYSLYYGQYVGGLLTGDLGMGSWNHYAMSCYLEDTGTNIVPHLAMYINGRMLERPYHYDPYSPLQYYSGVQRWDLCPGDPVPQPHPIPADHNDQYGSLKVGEHYVMHPGDKRILKCNWIRISNIVRYPTSFTPDPFCEPPVVDGDTVALWPCDEVSGITLDNIQGDPNLDGTIINPI